MRNFNDLYTEYMNKFAYLLGSMNFKFNGSLDELNLFLEKLTDKYFCSKEKDITIFISNEIDLYYKVNTKAEQFFPSSFSKILNNGA